VILCHCYVVSDKAVSAAVDQGARTLAGVCRSTGAGRDCGTCVLSVKHAMRAAQSTSEAAVAAMAADLADMADEVA
jgi:bacterioferritin-associated ferredoxin